MRLRWILPALLMMCAGAFAPVSLAQDKPTAEVQAPAANAPAPNPEVKQAARALIEEGLKASHAAEIFRDLRKTLAEVYIPAVRDLIQGSTPGVPPPDAKTAAALAKVLTFMDYARKAGDELDVALAENRDAMISDAAGQIAKTAELAEIADIRKALDLPAVHKTLDAVYAMTKLVTGFSYEDSRTFSGFSAWAQQQDLDWEHALPGMGPGAGKPVPSKQKMAKAQAFVNDLLAVSHADEIAADVSRFMREVYAETAPMSEEDREELIQQVQQYEFLYNMQKAVVLAAAPSVVAATLSDDQLAVMHKFVRSPAYAKLFDLVRDAVKAGTALTKEDVLEAQKSFKDLEDKAQKHERSAEEQDKAQAEWDALIEKWTNTLKDRISPDTRSGFDRSLEDLQSEDAPI